MDKFLESLIKYIIDNLPEIIGIAIGSLIIGVVGWLISKMKFTQKKVEGDASAHIQNASQSNYLVHYISDVIRRGSTLSFGDPASWAIGSEDEEGVVTLNQIWTPLRVADSQIRKDKHGTHESMAEEHLGIDLLKFFTAVTEPLIILGDPGSGKSTSLAMFAVDAARQWSENSNQQIPIWVSLASINDDGKSSPEEMLLKGVPEISLAITRSGLSAGEELKKILLNYIVQGNALLLLDGLDEVKEHMLPKLRTSISHTVGLNKGSRVIVTCRTFDYRQSVPNRKIPIDRELELLPFSPEEQKLYVNRWYDASVRIGRFTEAQADELATALIQELRIEGITELAESPLLLALLVLIHSEEAKLPDTRAVVCDRAIKYMLADSAKWRTREAGSSTLASPPVLSLAIELAYQNHVQEEKKAEGNYTGITAKMINDLASKICDIMYQADPSRKVALPDDIAQRFLRSHGLLLNIGNNNYKFAHRSFQEFLVGQYFAGGAHHVEAIKRATSTHWREPFRLMASFAGHEGENLFYILTLIRELLFSNNQTPISSIQLGAEMLSEIGRRRLALQQFGNELNEDGLWTIAQSKLAMHVENPKLKLAERERSATTLGHLGDPRIVTNGKLTNILELLIDIPGGDYNIGSERPDKEQVKTSGGFVASVRKVNFQPYRIGRYPVTNADFRAFVEGDGYSNMEYWKGEMALGWVSGDQNILDRIREHWISTLNIHHAKEIRDGEIVVERIEEESIARTSPRNHPYYWFDRKFNQPNQPVVGINWWEANAFCEWATKMGHNYKKLDTDYLIKLPTEFEWERASRPIEDDRIYPWGDEWDDEKAHVSTNKLNMRQPSPVGIYLESWPGSPLDLAGNVWEWTASLHLPYSPDHDTKRFSENSIDERVVRGSSWLNTSIVSACSVRCVDRSYNLFYDVGFRIVAIHRDSENNRL